ncbi:MAG: hypothetical protein A2Z45_04085 [Chloroflexi bacterium RBG_19FT_COMBO_55_16]|nr:MAG: hypothetical protein A2Z45_04085 [Chloroflexi bacterium RBG_19FT_COMBO_55_16]
MRTIRASEIGAYLYCQRAWWLQRQGYVSENQAELAGGNELHYHHARRVMVSGALRLLAYALFLLGLVILTIYISGQLI